MLSRQLICWSQIFKSTGVPAKRDGETSALTSNSLFIFGVHCFIFIHFFFEDPSFLNYTQSCSTMVSRTVSLIAYRGASTQRAHFAIFIPFAYDQGKGTIIHVVGSPMAGYELEFKRNYSLAHTRQSYTRHTIGQIDTQYIADDPDATVNAPSTTDYTPRSPIEVVASQVRPPRISQNFMAPVNDVSRVEILFVVCLLMKNNCRQQTKDVRNGQWNIFINLLTADTLMPVQSRLFSPNVILQHMELVCSPLETGAGEVNR